MSKGEVKTKIMVHISGPLKWNVIEPMDDTISWMLEIEKSILSEKYDLPVLTHVKGELVGALQRRTVPVVVKHLRSDITVEEHRKMMDELQGKEVELVLWSPKIGLVDFLHITKKTWRELFRDYGIVQSFSIELKLTELMEYEEK